MKKPNTAQSAASSITEAIAANCHCESELARIVQAAIDIETQRMRDALSFYADRNNWKDIETGIGCFPGPAIDDSGKRAREILSNLT